MEKFTGTYVCKQLGGEFRIINSKDSAGEATAQLSLKKLVKEDLNLGVSIFYSFKQSVGPEATLVFHGFTQNPNHFFGGTGFISDIEKMDEIHLAGGYSTYEGIDDFKGKFVRVAG